MASLLGKRKRRQDVDSSPPAEASDDQAIYKDALRKHFESVFEPIPDLQSSSTSPFESHITDTDDGSSNTSVEWDGLSSDEETPPIQIIDHTTTNPTIEEEDDLKSLRKRFMSSRPPVEASTEARKSRPKSEEDGPKSASNLTAEDLALQRLISESHLLSSHPSTTTTGPALLPTLKARHQAQDLRLQKLGAKKSISVLGAGNTPMSIRKGIQAKRDSREKTRRQEAKENGIILEREVKSDSKGKVRKRARDVGAPAVGKWRGGTLVLGKKDVAEIQDQKLRSDFGKRGKGGGKGKGRRR